MDLLKKQLDRIQQQLAGLSASQKMLTFSLLAIMVMTFLWWGKYAGTSEMEPVINQSLTADDMTNVKRVLRAESIPFEVSGDRILVNTERKEEAIAALALEQALPRDSSGSLEDVFNNMSPFDPPQMTGLKLNAHLEQNLARIISKMKGVAEATVHIDPTHERAFEGDVEPKASVAVRMRPGASADKKLAEAIAEWVSGSNANMRRSRVSVIIDDKVWPIRDRDPNQPDGEIDQQQASAEKRAEDNIKRAIGFYGDVIAVVHAKVDTIASQISETTHPHIVVKATREQSDTNNTSTPQPGQAEPGVGANSGLAVGPAPAPAISTIEQEKNTTESQIIADERVEHSTKPPGEAKVTSATVSVPRSYFINMLKQLNGSASEPTAADVENAFAQQRTKILAQVMNAVDLTDQAKISVDMYFDAPLMMATGSSASSGGSGSSPVTLTLSGHLKEIAIGILALISLFMVSAMVKKSAPAPVVTAAAVEATEPPILGGNIDIAGEVSEGGQTLDGMELDEDAIRAQQMVEQVSTMVKENPDGAAQMVKRWLNRS